jgi:hypothetical protein
MPMLVMNDVFARTWGARAGIRPAAEYWPELIGAVKARYPDLLFVAEAYWGLEGELQRQGFDLCYDKGLYDLLVHGDAEYVRQHLRASDADQARLIRFVENHDEPRAAATFQGMKQRSVAVVATTVPGARLLHEGQLDGRRVRVPVFLGRRPAESVDPATRAFYVRLLSALQEPALRAGEWQLAEARGWADNQNGRNLVAWMWRKDDSRVVVVVNLSAASAQARIPLGWLDPGAGQWSLRDLIKCEAYERSGGELADPGLFVDLPGWGFHFLRLEPG